MKNLLKLLFTTLLISLPGIAYGVSGSGNAVIVGPTVVNDCLKSGGGVLIKDAGTTCGGGGGGGVSSLNTLTGDVVLGAGSNITITPSGNTLTIASSGGGATLPIETTSDPETIVENASAAPILATDSNGGLAIINQQSGTPGFAFDSTRNYSPTIYSRNGFPGFAFDASTEEFNLITQAGAVALFYDPGTSTMKTGVPFDLDGQYLEDSTGAINVGSAINMNGQDINYVAAINQATSSSLSIYTNGGTIYYENGLSGAYSWDGAGSPQIQNDSGDAILNNGPYGGQLNDQFGMMIGTDGNGNVQIRGGFNGTCSAVMTITVVNGIITGCD